MMPQPLWGKSAQNREYSIEHGVWLRAHCTGFAIPDFQRPLVWTDAQKVRFIESIYLGLPIGSWVFAQEITDAAVITTLLDGQQRWDAIFSFVDGKIAVNGHRFDELVGRDKWRLLHAVFPAVQVNDLTYEEQKDIYERLAYGGTPHTLKVTS